MTPTEKPQNDYVLHAGYGSYAITGAPIGMALQTEITKLVEFPYEPDTAAWVTNVRNAPVEVVAGAIAMWVPGPRPGGWVPNDIFAPRREAAMAILHARFADQSGQQTKTMLRLTRVIAWLTGVMLLAVVVQILIAVSAPTD